MSEPSAPSVRLRALREIPWILAAAVVPFALALKPVREPDLGWLLAVGRYVQQTGGVPHSNPWTYTTPEYPFAATSWLFGWAMYWLERLGGWTAIELGTAVMVGATFALLYAVTRAEGAGPRLALATTWVGAVVSQFRFSPRPHVGSYLLLTLTMLVLLHVRRTRKPRALLAVPLIVAFWSNVHAGSIFGATATGCFFAAEFIEALLSRERPLPRRWLLLCAACVGATGIALLANPYGLELLRYDLFHLGRVNEVVQLDEFLPPSLADKPNFWLVLPFIPLAFAAGRRRDVFAWLLLLSFGVGATRIVRLVPKAMIVLLPLAAVAARNAARKAAERWPGLARLGGHRLTQVAAGSMVGVVPLTVLAINPFPLMHFVERIRLGPNVYSLPEKMADFVEKHGIRGRCFSSWDVVGYVMWRLPESPIFDDPRTRAYPPELFQELKKSDSDQATFDALMARYDTEWAFRGHGNVALSGIGRFTRDKWAVIYWDEAGQVLVRRDIERFAPLVKDLEFKYFLPGSQVTADFRKLKGEERARWVEEMRRVAEQSPRVVDAQTGLCLEYTRTGALAEAAEACDRAVADLQDHKPYVYIAKQLNNSSAKVATALAFLGQRTLSAGNTEAGQAIFRRALAVSPHSPVALVALGMSVLPTQPREARKLFEEALENSPSYAPALKGLAKAHSALGEGREAELVRLRLSAATASETEP